MSAKVDYCVSGVYVSCDLFQKRGLNLIFCFGESFYKASHNFRSKHCHCQTFQISKIICQMTPGSRLNSEGGVNKIMI